MKKNALSLFLGLCLTSFLLAQPALYTTEIDSAILHLSDMKAVNKVPGVSITVMKKGEIVFSEGLGYADLEQRVPVDPARTKFRVGSVSKPMTAAALAKLYEEGKIDLDAPIQRYVPFPKKEYDLSLRQLAGHIAGIRHYKGDEFLSAKNYETVTEGLDIFKDDPLLFKPGEKYSYSSYAWNLISAAIEAAAGEDFLSYVDRVVFDELGLENTVADHVDSLIPYRTRYYERTGSGEIVNAPFVDNSYKWAGGGFLSTTEDLAKFGHAHIKEGYLKQSTLDLWRKSQQTNDGKMTNYGIGWRSGEYGGKKWFGHSGGSVGGITQLIIYPAEEVVVAVLTNSSNVNYRNVHHRIAHLFMN
jgi:serine beta-lactamase-like protein LACTB